MRIRETTSQKARKKPVTLAATGFFAGGPEEIRTLDLSDANRTLSQLSYRPKYAFIVSHEKSLGIDGSKAFLCPGGDKRDRTADLLNAIQALSQLSYTPISGVPHQNIDYNSKVLRECQGDFENFFGFPTIRKGPPSQTAGPFEKGSAYSAAASAAALAARYRKVTIWPRVQVLSGEKVVSLVPLVTPFSTAQATAGR